MNQAIREWGWKKEQKRQAMVQSFALLAGSMNQYNQSYNSYSHTPSGSSVFGLTPSQTQQVLGNNPTNSPGTNMNSPSYSPTPSAQAQTGKVTYHYVVYVDSSDPTRWWADGRGGGMLNRSASFEDRFVGASSDGRSIFLKPNPSDSSKWVWSDSQGNGGAVVIKTNSARPQITVIDSQGNTSRRDVKVE
jgi:hypothetical protein